MNFPENIENPKFTVGFEQGNIDQLSSAFCSDRKGMRENNLGVRVESPRMLNAQARPLNRARESAKNLQMTEKPQVAPFLEYEPESAYGDIRVGRGQSRGVIRGALKANGHRPGTAG